MITWLLVLAILLPWFGAGVIWLTGEKRPTLTHTLSVLVALVTGIITITMIPLTQSQPISILDLGHPFGVLTFVPDGLGVFLANIASLIGSLAVLFSVGYLPQESQIGRYYALVLLFIGAMVGLVLSGGLLALFIFWEITALCSYALISFDNDNPQAVAGGIKALIITQLGGVGLLAGTLTAYAYLGSYQIETLLEQSAHLPAEILRFVAFGFLLAAMAKSAQVPLHSWLPDAMEAPTPVSALIHAATMVNAGVYLLARFYPAFASVPNWKTAVLTVGLLSVLLSGVMALTATDLKRVLAYSTISQLGYMVYAIGVGAVSAGTLHLFSHAIFKALLFLAAGAVIHAVSSRDMRQMGGLGRQMPFVATVFIIGAGALAGLPLFNGFFSKELILEGGAEGGPIWAYGGMVFGAGLTALYTLRMVEMVFLGAAHSPTQHHFTPFVMRLALIPLAVGAATTWLIMGEFTQWLAETLPFHHFHPLSTWELIQEILLSPNTWLTFTVILLGFLLWWQRAKVDQLATKRAWLAAASCSGFGFDWFNQQIINQVKREATLLRATQTGQLNWNIMGIVIGLLAVLLILVMQ